VLKTREGYYRNWDHQLMQEMYTIRFLPTAEIKNQWDILTTSPPVPAASQSLEVIAPTREDNNCTMPAGRCRGRGASPPSPTVWTVVAIQIFEQVVNGLLVGAYYLLIALGLSLIFSLGGLVNLAHGSFYALGAYFAVKLADHIGYAGAFVASPLAVALIGLVIERFLFRRFYREDPALGLLMTFGLAMVAEQALRLIFGASPLPFSIPQALKGQFLVGDFIYSRYRLVMLVIAAAAVGA